MVNNNSTIEAAELWVDKHGDALYNYALSRLHNHTASEDVVQETFLAALRGQETFTGQSTTRTWLIGILKHKIIDLIRKNVREQSFDTNAPLEILEDDLFNANGRWRVAPKKWQINPEKIFEQHEFMEILASCLEHLPEQLRHIFILRELEYLTSNEICKKLTVSSTNLWVILYRARIRLRACLSHNWFDSTQKDGE